MHLLYILVVNEGLLIFLMTVIKLSTSCRGVRDGGGGGWQWTPCDVQII